LIDRGGQTNFIYFMIVV